MQKQFVTHEIALALKELGFDEKCLAFFYSKESILDTASANAVEEICRKFNAIKAPLHQQVIDWFREKHGLEISIISWENNIIPNRSESIAYVLYSGIKFKYNIYKYNPWHIYDSGYTFNNYDEAREQVILKCIKLLN